MRMASLRYMTMVDDVMRGLAKAYPELSDPERRLEISRAVEVTYSADRPETVNRDAIQKAAEALLKPAVAEPRMRAEIGEIYVYNIAWMERGAVFATEVHHISSGEDRDAIEEFLAENSKVDRNDEEGVSWVSITNNVPFDILTDDTVVRFVRYERDGLADIGQITVAEMRDRVHRNPLSGGAE
jgi:hypothetical protein